MQTDGDGIYNYPCGMCYLCRDNEGVASYIPATYLKIVSYEKAIDWEERRYQICKEVLCGLLSTDKKPMVTYGEHCREALIYADEMIKQLKGE